LCNSKGPLHLAKRRRKMRKLVITAVGCVLLFPGFTLAKDMVFKGEVMDSQCAKVGSHDMMMKKAGLKDAKSCSQACVKMGGKYVLYNAATKKTYQLDDQTKAEQLAGDKVRLTGTLDKATETIHVTEIEAAS